MDAHVTCQHKAFISIARISAWLKFLYNCLCKSSFDSGWTMIYMSLCNERDLRDQRNVSYFLFGEYTSICCWQQQAHHLSKWLPNTYWQVRIDHVPHAIPPPLGLCSPTSFLYTLKHFVPVVMADQESDEARKAKLLAARKKVKREFKYHASIMLIRLNCTAQEVSEQEARCFTHSRFTPSNRIRRQW